MRIAIVNDLAMAREILRRLVLSVPGYEVAWMAENGEQAVSKSAQDRHAKVGQAQPGQGRGRTAPGPPAATVPRLLRPARRLHPVIAVGSSTGGPEALARILKALPATLAASLIIVQHIAADFAPSL